ncbi:T9SS type A sorting domain-containing protein [Flavobacterium sp. J27]|uniref:T9SS type A sorting domain-containing protein n=1 Tax=Flavobacterium sp. J27 TaxID=2060419 RepID=UPI00103061EB|nr:T9SS type A sorting domain-containing protein [Flavobacterium sp. J27]
MQKNYFTLKHSFFIFFCLFFYKISNSQTWQWAIDGGSNNQISGTEKTIDMLNDPQGNLYFLSTIGKIGLQLDGMPLTAYDGGSNRDYLIASYDCNGTYRWNKVIGGPSTDRIENLQVDGAGNIYVSGTVYNSSQNFSVHFDTDSIIPFSVLPDVNKKNLFLLKYNPDGVFQWLRMPQQDNVSITEAFSHSLGLGVQTDIQGNSYWLCLVPPGTYAEGAFVNNTAGDHFFIFKYDTYGTFLEAIPLQFELIGVLDEFKFLRNSNTGGFYIGGTFDPDNGIITVGDQNINSNMYLVAFDSNGNYIWKIENDPNIFGKITDFCIDSNNDIYITGSGLAGDSFAGQTFTSNQPHMFPYIIKIDDLGQGIWSTNAETLAASDGNAIVINNNEIAITGQHASITWDDVTLTQQPNAFYDVFFARFNKSDGTIISLEDLESNFGASEFGYALSSDNNNNYYLGGNFNGYLYFNGDTFSASWEDFFVAKYGSANCPCVSPQPSFSFSQDGQNEQTFTFNYSGSLPYDSIIWDFDDGNTSIEGNPQHTFNNLDTYNVCVTATNSCGSQSYCYEINNMLNTDDFRFANTSVYPNPFNNSITVSTDSNLKYKIYSLLGVEITSGNIISGKTELFLSKYSAGYYLLQLENENGNIKIMKILKK